MVCNSLHYDSAKMPSPGEIWFFSCDKKYPELSQSECIILWSSIYLEGIKWFLDFLCGDNHLRNVASETVTFGWMWPVLPLGQSDCRILWASISLEESNYSHIFCLDIIVKKRYLLRLSIFVGCDQLHFRAHQIVGFFDHQYLWKDSSIILIFYTRNNIKET